MKAREQIDCLLRALEVGELDGVLELLRLYAASTTEDRAVLLGTAMAFDAGWNAALTSAAQLLTSFAEKTEDGSGDPYAAHLMFSNARAIRSAARSIGGLKR